MRVLLVHNRYRVPGGEERHIDLLELALHSAGAEVARFEAMSVAPSSLRGRLRVSVGMVYRPVAAHEIKRVLAEFQPDIVHVHNLLPMLSPAVLHEASRAAKVVMTAHNYRLVCPAGTLVRRGRFHDDCVAGSSLLCGLRGARQPWLESVAYGIALEIHRRLRLVERWVDVFIAPSLAVADILARAGIPAAKVHVIAHGVPVGSWAPRRRTHALFAGRLAPEKGVATLLDAIRLAPEVPVYVAGEGPLSNRVRALGDRYLGHLGHGELSDWQQAAAFSIVPSECPEALSFAAVESLAVGTPVVASAVGGLREVVASPGCGELVPPGDPSALARAMRRLWVRAQSDPAYGREAWESAGERYNLVRQTEAVLTLYDGRGRHR